MRVLIVANDPALLGMLVKQFRAEHYAIDTAADGVQALDYTSTYDYDLLVVDILVPRLDGLSLCQKLRQDSYFCPILLLADPDAPISKTMGLDAGADDYIVKPFDLQELIARVRALLRRSSMNPFPILTWGDLWLNTNNQEVSYRGTPLELTTTEYAFLEMMLQNSHKVLSKEAILESLWSAEEFPTESTVRSHMRRLRQKLTTAGAPTDLIATSHGRGYYLKALQVTPEAAIPEVSQARQPPNPVLEGLNQTWQKYRDYYLSQVQQVRTILQTLQADLTQADPIQADFTAFTAKPKVMPPIPAQAKQIIHNLVGTLGTFGLTQAMQDACLLEQYLGLDDLGSSNLALGTSALGDGLALRQVQHLQELLEHINEQIVSTSAITAIPQGLKPEISQAPISQALISHSPASPPQASSPLAKVRVLVVDDDPILLQTLPNQLQGYGLDVSTLSDPHQFWTVLPRITPDILILDIQMPGINGIELCQSLRAQPDWQKLPVLFLSVFGDAQTQHQAFTAGADDYLCKPVNAQMLSARIFNRLKRIAACARH
jgi:DNA-binding response OmpR family regulator